MRASRFEVQSAALAEFVEPARGQSYVHRCPLSVFEQICHVIDERDSFTLEDLVLAGVAKSSQAALALRFLREWGLLERAYPRRNRRTEDSIHLSAMVCLHGMAHAEAV